MQLANRNTRQWAVRDAIDHEPTRSADAFATIMIECYRLFTLIHQTFVQDIQHFEE
jgi:hypothetical protein